jgi:DNA-binding transcriptional ArsR family regulator
VSADLTEAAYAAIADPTRRRIVRLLKREGPLASSAVASAIPELARPGISRHLGILMRAELVRVDPRAQKRIYQLRRDGFERLALEWMGFLEEGWQQSLRDLKHRSEAAEGTLD